MHDLHSYLSVVQLDSFPNLKYLRYGSTLYDVVLPYTIRQLGAVTSPCGVIHLTLDLNLHRNRPDPHLCSILDGLLTGDRFPCLQSVKLHRLIAPELFPKLNKAGRIEVLGSSLWIYPTDSGSIWSTVRNQQRK